MEDRDTPYGVKDSEEEKKDIEEDFMASTIFGDLKARELKIKMKKHSFGREFLLDIMTKLTKELICSEESCQNFAFHIARDLESSYCKVHFGGIEAKYAYFKLTESKAEIGKYLNEIATFFSKTDIISAYLTHYTALDQVGTDNLTHLKKIKGKMRKDVQNFITKHTDQKKVNKEVSLKVLRTLSNQLGKLTEEMAKTVACDVFNANINHVLTEVLSIHHDREVDLDEDDDDYLFNNKLYKQTFTLVGTPYLGKEKYELISQQIEKQKLEIDELKSRKDYSK